MANKNPIEKIEVDFLPKGMLDVYITRRGRIGITWLRVYRVVRYSPTATILYRVVNETLLNSRRWRIELTPTGWRLVDNRNHGCDVCGGEFYTTSTDYVPWGSTSVPMDMHEVCECVFNGCPRCGGKVEEKRNHVGRWFVGCADCGWELE